MQFISKKGLATRLSINIIAGATVIFILLFIFNYYKSSSIIEKKIDLTVDQITKIAEIKLEAFFLTVEKLTKQAALYAITGKYTKKDIQDYLLNYVQVNEDIFGSTYSFEPFVVDNATSDFAPYYFKKNGLLNFVELSNNYNYREKPWYYSPKDNGLPCWQDPYFDDGGGDIFMTTYSVPIFRNYDNKFIGVVTSDVSLEWLKSFLNSINVFNSGYSFILSKSGRIVAHPFATFAEDSTIFHIAKKFNNQNLEELGKMMTSGIKGKFEYFCPYTKEDGIVSFESFAGNNWSFAYFYPKSELKKEINELSTFLIIFGICGAFALLLLIIIVSKTISKPLNIAANANEIIAKGELAKAGEYLDNSVQNKSIFHFEHSKSEILRFFAALKLMSDKLLNLLAKVKHSSQKVKNSAKQISLSSQELEATVIEQGATTNQFAKSIKEIAKTSEELATTMNDVSTTVFETSKSAEAGFQKLNKMKERMMNFSNSTRTFSSKLSIIAEKTNKITTVVSTINKISDQTNLLSLNASIEAEKAGEYGKGFSVVAREISRLADQTSIATRDIEIMVKEMQSSVSSGVMEMDKFYQDVLQSMSEVINIINLISSIVEQVQNLKPSFESVSVGMQNHNEITSQINESIEQLNFTIEHTKTSLFDFKNATKQLDEVIKELQEEISYFKL